MAESLTVIHIGWLKDTGAKASQSIIFGLWKQSLRENNARKSTKPSLIFGPQSQ